MAKKTKGKTDSTELSSWRGIKQTGGRKAVTELARKRRLRSFLKLGLTGISALLVLGVSGFGLYQLKVNRGLLKLRGPSPAVRRIVFESDGVLNPSWVEGVLKVPVGKEMMGIDIFEVKKTLEEFGQIKTAEIARKFPDQLVIRVKERQPVLRARIPGEKTGFEEVLIAGDGFVYRGHNYSGATLDLLPYLGGVRFFQKGNGFKAVPGMRKVAELLTLARENYPGIYASWNVVLFDHFTGEEGKEGEFITVKGGHIKAVKFSPDEFERQLHRLARVIEYSGRRDINALKEVDLSLGRQVVVRYYPKLRPAPASSPFQSEQD